jgi:N,N'-diacetylbacillosaminyl-diphospho-undecaprenol alpha-1,3-N-acetylgalactosaminyltransferase
LKIAFLSHSDFNLYMFRLSWMKALMKDGFCVYAVTPEGEYSEKFIEEGIKVIHYSIRRESLNPLKELKVIHNLYKIFKSEKFGLLHTFTIKPNIYGSIAGKLSGVPVIINTVTGLGYIYTVDNFKTRFLRIMSNLLYRICFRISKKIIFQNADDFMQLKSIISDSKKVVIIEGTGVDTRYFSQEAVNRTDIESMRNGIGSDGKLVITMIARLYWSKGIREFVDAAQALMKTYKNLLFLVVGWIDKGNPDAIPEEFIKMNHGAQIKFLGKREDIREILFLTDIYVLPSYREGLSRTILEAMSMGKAVVTADVAGCRDAVENEANGLLVKAKDSKSLMNAIEKLILDNMLREKMGKIGREKVIKYFSNEIVVNKILQLYKELDI